MRKSSRNNMIDSVGLPGAQDGVERVDAMPGRR